MRTFRLARKAREDLTGIRDYTRRRWGAAQCKTYLTELRASFRRLAENPLLLGHAADEIRPGLRRSTQGLHIVFYVPKPYGVRIVRVLHEVMQHDLHDFSDEDDLV